MVLKVNESRVHKVENETINGLNVVVLLEADAVNTDIPVTSYGDGAGFDSAEVSIEVNLMRDGQNITICNANLGLLAQWATKEKNGQLWRKGIVLQKKGAAKTQIVSRQVFIDLKGHYNISGSDVLTVTASVGRGTYGAGVSSANSVIQIETNQSIGVELAVHRIQIYAIGANQNSDLVNLGDNVTEVALLSFSKDDTKPIFKSASFSSDRLDWQANEQELILRHWNNFDDSSADLLIMAGETHPLYFPHTFVVHKTDEVDRCKLQFTMNSANVVASQNFVVYSSYVTSRDVLNKAIQLTAKHEQKNIEKVPLSL